MKTVVLGNTVQVNEFWTVTYHGPRNYTARRAETPGWPEQTRFYFSREALEADLGPIVFDGEQLTRKG